MGYIRTQKNTTPVVERRRRSTTGVVFFRDPIYWYRWPDHAFGFSQDAVLFLKYADCGIKRYPEMRDMMASEFGRMALNAQFGRLDRGVLERLQKNVADKTQVKADDINNNKVDEDSVDTMPVQDEALHGDIAMIESSLGP